MGKLRRKTERLMNEWKAGGWKKSYYREEKPASLVDGKPPNLVGN